MVVEAKAGGLAGAEDGHPETLHLGGEGAWPFQTDHRRNLAQGSTNSDKIRDNSLESADVERKHNVSDPDGLSRDSQGVGGGFCQGTV